MAHPCLVSSRGVSGDTFAVSPVVDIASHQPIDPRFNQLLLPTKFAIDHVHGVIADKTVQR